MKVELSFKNTLTKKFREEFGWTNIYLLPCVEFSNDEDELIIAFNFLCFGIGIFILK